MRDEISGNENDYENHVIDKMMSSSIVHSGSCRLDPFVRIHFIYLLSHQIPIYSNRISDEKSVFGPSVRRKSFMFRSVDHHDDLMFVYTWFIHSWCAAKESRFGQKFMFFFSLMKISIFAHSPVTHFSNINRLVVTLLWECGKLKMLSVSFCGRRQGDGKRRSNGKTIKINLKVDLHQSTNLVWCSCEPQTI